MYTTMDDVATAVGAGRRTLLQPGLGGRTWRDVDRAPRRALLVPLGALEQHGPHLPLDTDTRIASAVAAAAAADQRGVGVAPALPIGASGEHAGFPGTLSIGTDALGEVLLELGRDASAHWAAVLFVNAHGGNEEATARAVGRLRDEGRRCAVFHATVPGGDAHAGRTETSLLLHLAPALVRAELLEAGATEAIGTLLPRLRASGVRSVSPSGVLGDPRGAGADEGERLLAQLTAACRAQLAALLAEDR